MRKNVVGIVLLVTAALGGGAFYHFGVDPGTAELVAALEQAKKSTNQLRHAQEAEQNAEKALTLARQAEAKAKASGDLEKQKHLAVQTSLREAELRERTNLVEQRKAEQKKAIATTEAKAIAIGADAKPRCDPNQMEKLAQEMARRNEQAQKPPAGGKELIAIAKSKSCGA